jgi:hypothetical protein
MNAQSHAAQSTGIDSLKQDQNGIPVNGFYPRPGLSMQEANRRGAKSIGEELSL